MSSKLNVKEILCDHFNSLINDNTGKPDFSDIFSFLLFPIIGSSILVYFKIFIDSDRVDTLISALSIFVGLLLNVIVIIFDLIKKDRYKSIKNELLEEVLANISFAVFLSIICIIMLLFTLFSNCIAQYVFNSFSYFFLIEFVLTLIMVLKRMYILFKNEMNRKEESNPENCPKN